MKRIQKYTCLCLEEYLTKSDCYTLIKQNHMQTLQYLCNKDKIDTSLFVVKDASLNDIYVTPKDWNIFLNSSKVSSDVSSNALSHYIGKDKSRISTDSIFFTDSASSITLLNPRFTYLVKQLNDGLKKEYPDIHKEIKVLSTPNNASEIESYYTEALGDVNFFLKVSYVEDSRLDDNIIKLVKDKPSFLRMLRDSLNKKASFNSVSNYSLLQKDKNLAIVQDIEKLESRVLNLSSFLNNIELYLDDIDSLIEGKKVFSKKIKETLYSILPDKLQNCVIDLIRTGKLEYGSIRESISNKSLLGSSLRKAFEDKLDALESIKNSYIKKLKGGDSVEDDKSDDREITVLKSYKEKILSEIDSIFDFVTEQPFNSKGNIPANILTTYRNKEAIIFVLNPDTSDSRHRVMYIYPDKDTQNTLKFFFSAAGTETSIYEIKDGHLKVTV